MNLKQKLSKKLKKTGGFTLIEMLIVVAIIAILVAVSIPMVSSSLDKAKVATDQANERAAKAAAIITYMTTGTTGTCYYDANTGTIVTTAPTASKYGQCSKHKDGYIKLTIGTDGTVSDLEWAEVPATGGDSTAHSS
ncbi:type II secretion system protein [Intestinimonas sp. HCP28S3_D6]|uniref:type II secretion system protein n=1 Tax=Intestinimonas sp. HCP28S3_D6 TaxID=3438942 RepID=UPI003F8A8760